MEEINREVLATIITDVLRPDLVSRVIQTAQEMFESTDTADRRTSTRRDLEQTEREVARLTEAVAMSSESVPALMQRLNASQRKRRELLAELASTSGGSAPRWDDLERRMRCNLTGWRARFEGATAEARQGFRELLTAPILFEPCVVRGYRAIRFTGRVGLEGVFGSELVTKVASPTSPTRCGHGRFQEMLRPREDQGRRRGSSRQPDEPRRSTAISRCMHGLIRPRWCAR